MCKSTRLFSTLIREIGGWHGVLQTPRSVPVAPTLEELRQVAPALAHYMRKAVLDGLWKHPGLPPRGRSIVTLSVLIARNQAIELPFYLNLALDNGVKSSGIAIIESKRTIMNISFGTKVALVTDASSGLGLTAARAFAVSGASVVLTDWHEESRYVRPYAPRLSTRK